MIFRDCIDIELPPEPIWEMLRYAEYQELWNRKCVHCPGLGRPLQLGDRYSATYRLSRESQSEVEVIEFEPLRSIAFRHHPEDMGGYAEERYSLEPRKNGQVTRVRQELDMRKLDFPLWVRPLLWLIALIGRKVGNDGPLEGLRDAAIAQAKMGDV